MDSTTPQPGRRITLVLAGLISLVSMVVVLAIAGTHEGHAESGHYHATPVESKHSHSTATTTARKTSQVAFHDAIRKLWEDHITWTRLAIISLAQDLPDLQATQDRLLRNQDDIGNAIKPFYGKKAGNQLTALLKEHITGAVALLQAAKSGDDSALKHASADWYANGNEIADFLSKANPDNWPRKTMRSMMKGHLDQTLDEAVHRLTGKYAADVRDYDHIHRHILMMADALSSGIIAQFPQRFR